MIYFSKKYRSLRDFIFQNDESSTEIRYSLLLGSCTAVIENPDNKTTEKYRIGDSCFYCNFCYFDSLKNIYQKKILEIQKQYDSKTFFNGNKVNMPNAKFFLREPRNKNLETFSSVEETKRIQPWATTILSMSTPFKCSSALELPAVNTEFDRDGRIDIGIKENDNFLFIETKTNLQEAMVDERFVEQHSKYIPAIEENIDSNTTSYALCILIGGKETDLYPPSHKLCTGITGNLSKRFYKLISENERRIPFFSANALWALSMHHLENNNFSITNFLIELFSDEYCFGLVSAGKIIFNPENNSFEIKTFKLT